tara:strand:- start:521 stop:1075 length:555 start_codon:yes stop_codon:yes gene_type:complete
LSVFVRDKNKIMLTDKSNFKGVSQTLLQFGAKPAWKLLCRPLKKVLLKQLGEKKYNNIHDPRFYQDLETQWQSSEDFLIDVLLQQQEKVECAICMETYKVTDKVTTLMCGHKFCTRCIMQHMCRHGDNTQCPLCRKYVYEFELNQVESVTEETVEHTALQRKREKRRLERMKKRQCKKEKKINL